MREFVPLDLVADLDLSGLQRINPKFHSSRRSARREGDVIWQQVIDEQKPQGGARLPPVLSLVLYNGERRWKAAGTTGELIAIAPDSPLWHRQPQARYHVLDMGAFSKDELARHPNAVALLFRLEQRHSPAGLRKLVNEVSDWFRRHAGHERLQGLFVELIDEACAECGAKLSGSRELLKEKSMLATSIKAWKEQWRAEGKAEGLAEALVRLLALRFGKVGPSWEKRIRGAKLVTLERWFERAIVAPDLRSVFNPPR